MLHIILSHVSSPALRYFPTLSHKLHDFWKKGHGTWNEFLIVFMFLWPCIVSKAWRKNTNKMQQYKWFIVNSRCWLLTTVSNSSNFCSSSVKWMLVRLMVRGKDAVCWLLGLGVGCRFSFGVYPVFRSVFCRDCPFPIGGSRWLYPLWYPSSWATGPVVNNQ